MRIVHVVDSLGFGGLEKLLHDLLLEYSPQDSIAIICLDEIGHWGERLKYLGYQIDVVGRNGRKKKEIFKKLLKFLDVYDPEILHAHTYAAWYFCVKSKLKSKLNASVISTKHGGLYRPDFTKKFIERWLAGRTDKIIAVSEDLRKNLKKRLKVSENKLKTIINGIRIQDFRFLSTESDILDKYGVSGSFHAIIGHVARCDEIKDQRTLLRGFARLTQDNSNVLLLFVGAGPLLEELKVLSKSLNIERNVKFLGFNPNVPELLQVMDLFVLSSLYEGTSISILEAFIAGVPVIATKTGGNAALINNGENGILFPVGDVDSLFQEMKKFLTCRKQFQLMAKTAQKIAEQKYSISAMKNKYHNLYAEVRSNI